MTREMLRAFFACSIVCRIKGFPLKGKSNLFGETGSESDGRISFLIGGDGKFSGSFGSSVCTKKSLAKLVSSSKFQVSSYGEFYNLKLRAWNLKFFLLT